MSRPIARSARPLTSSLAVAALSVLAAAALVACAPAAGDARAAAPAATEPPAVPVAVVAATQVQAGALQVARVEAAQQVVLRARVAGPIDAVLFREGERVRAGQPLFQIDPRPFDAALSRARAELQLAQAREAQTAGEATRARQLHAERAIAAEEFERREAAHAEARARRAAAEAALQAAQLDRDFTLVRAPIDGRAGRALATAGNFVSAGAEAGPLVTLVAVAPLHVHVDVAERSLPDTAGAAGWKARILDADGAREIAVAPIDFRNHSVDAATGTLRLRARIDAPPAGLLPGQYVRVQIDTGTREPALTVPDAAIGTDQGRHFVLAVDAQGRVEYRAVQLGATVGAQRIVTQGLRAGEQVVASGLMRVRPGMQVKPQVDEAQADAGGPVPDRI